MFLSYVNFISTPYGGFSKGQDPSIRDAKGYLFIDDSTGNICVKVESVYIEISPQIKETMAPQKRG